MSERIRNLFSDISGKYDTMNHVLSFGVDTLWRRRAAYESIPDKESFKALDVATGTGDLAFAVHNMALKNGKKAEIVGMDFSKKMLDIAKAKAAKRRTAEISFELGDALNMEYEDNSFDVVTTAFSLRNFDDLDKFLKEVHRVLKPGGKFVFIDMAMPDSRFGRAFFKFYSKVMLAMGTLVQRNAYSWLVHSIMKFDKKRLVYLATKNEFNNVSMSNMVSGIAYIITGEK